MTDGLRRLPAAAVAMVWLLGAGWIASDRALAWIDQRTEFPLLTAEQLRDLPYRDALANLEAARVATDLDERARRLEFADRQLKEFLEANPTHGLAYAAELQLGAVLVERGRLRLELARQDDLAADESQRLVAAGRKLLAAANERFARGCEALDAEIRSYPTFIAPDDTERLEARLNLRQNLIQGRMFKAATTVELARSYPIDSEAWQTALTDAAEQFEKLYEDFRTTYAGLIARLKQAQCHQELGDTKRAVGLYRNLIDQPTDDATIRQLRAAAMYKSLECWLSPKEKRYELAMDQGQKFLAATEPSDLNRPEWVAVRYYTAVALRIYGQQLPADRRAERDDALLEARALATEVASVPGTLQARARQLVEQLESSD